MIEDICPLFLAHLTPTGSKDHLGWWVFVEIPGKSREQTKIVFALLSLLLPLGFSVPSSEHCPGQREGAYIGFPHAPLGHSWLCQSTTLEPEVPEPNLNSLTPVGLSQALSVILK